jgi:hypothetical protein
MGEYFQGSISPTMQHDAVFVGTEYGSPSVPAVALMPIAPVGAPSVGAAIQSGSQITASTTVVSAAAGSNGQVQFNNGGSTFGASSLFVWDNINNILTVASAVVTGNVTIGGSLIITGNITATIFNALTGFQIGGAAASGKYLRGNGTNFVSATLSGSDVGTGLLGVTYGGTGANLSATGGASQVAVQATTGATFTVRQLTYSDISGSSGLVPLANGGTNANLSATGGAHQVLQQSSSGGAVTVGQLSFSDISGMISPSELVSGSGNLTAQAANKTATTLFAVGSGGAGLYSVSVYIIISQAATVSSTLPDTRIIFTDQDSGATITQAATATSAGNTTSTFAQFTFVLNAKASTNIQYDIGQVNSYVSAGATPMQFAYRARVVYLG